jgi:hypothetical protein
MKAAFQLRALILNDEALLAHYGQWSGEHLAGECASTPELAEMERVLRRLRERREQLAAYTDAACSQPSAGRPACAVAGPLTAGCSAQSSATLAGALVTNHAEQPASISTDAACSHPGAGRPASAVAGSTPSP